jgi:hypothetical protein
MPGVKRTVSEEITTITNTVMSSIISLAVTPPTNGQLIVMGSGFVQIVQTTSKFNHALFSLNIANGMMADNYVLHAIGPSIEAQPGVPQNIGGPLNLIDVFPVTAGVTTTIYLNAERDATGVNNIYIAHPAITAIFVPNTLP